MRRTPTHGRRAPSGALPTDRAPTTERFTDIDVGPRSLGRVPDPDPAQQRRAALVITQTAIDGDWTLGELVQVLDTLGLRPQPEHLPGHCRGCGEVLTMTVASGWSVPSRTHCGRCVAAQSGAGDGFR